MTQSERTKQYWAEVRAGLRPKPERKPNGPVKRKLRCQSHWAKSGEVILTVYPHGELGFREPHRRAEYRLGLPEAFRQAVLITTAKIAARVKELRKQGHGRGATSRARKEILL